MKKHIKTLAIFILITLLFTSCSPKKELNTDGISVPRDKELSKSRFVDFFTEKGYEISEDLQGNFDEEGTAIQEYIIANNDVLAFEFVLYTDETTAKQSYINLVLQYEKEQTDDTTVLEETNEDHGKYVFIEQKYRSATRIGKTIILAAASNAQATEVQNILLELGY